MPANFIEDDLSTIFNNEEFGTSVRWNGVDIEGVILDDMDVEAQNGEGVIEIVPQPMLTGRSSDFEGIATGDPILIDTETLYVKNWKVDGTGVIEIFLRRGT